MSKPASKDYLQILSEMGLKLNSPLGKLKDRYEMTCMRCNHIFQAILIGKIQAYEKYKSGGCPSCHKLKIQIQKEQTHTQRKLKISDEYEILASDESNDKIIVKRKECGHTFSSNLLSIASDVVTCKECSNRKGNKTYGKAFDLMSYGFVSSLTDFGIQWKHITKNIIINIIQIDKILEQKVGRKYLYEYSKDLKADKVVNIFSDELIHKPALVLAKIKHLVQESKLPVIHGRKCTIREIDAISKNKFLNVNHIQGRCNATINLGAFCGDVLVAVMTFSKPRILMNRNEADGSIELVRFATDNRFRVIGIAGKLLSYFKKNYEWQNIYSFADLRYSVGNLYYQLGFTPVHETGPQYYYIVGNERKHRWGFRKDMIREKYPDRYDPSLTEYQNMLNIGIDRIWDCGMIKFDLKRT